MDSSITQRVDQLLLEQGEYQPIEYLLFDGRLMYSDYEQWRAGESDRLDQLLFGDPQEIAAELAEAAAYAQALGLVPETVRYTRWGAEEGLVTSRDQRLARHLEQVYQRPQARPQLDLFMDSTGTSLANGVVLSLGRRDLEEAARCLDRLYQADPGNARLGGLERLVEAARTLDDPLQNPVAELARLEQALLPLADELLGSAARHFMQPLWRRLHQGLRGRPFILEQPDLHTSHSALRMLDWEAVISEVEAENDWRGQPILLQRHLQAGERLRRPAQAAADLFELCWRFPAAATEVLRLGVLDLAGPWERFQELEPELDLALFPAWLLIIRPGMINWLAAPQQAQPESYHLVHTLQAGQAGRGGVKGDTVALRARLKALEPALFHHFIRNL